VSYLRERLTFVPWAVIPGVLYLLGRGIHEPFEPWLLAYLYAIVLQLRVLDDFFCFAYDRASGKSAAYLQRAPARLLPWLGVFSVAAVPAALVALPQGALLATACFLIVHPPAYRLLGGRAGLLAVSLAKYPFLMFTVAGLSDRPDYLWPALGTTFFLVREACEELGATRSRPVESGVVGLLVLTRVLSSSA